VVGIPDPLWGEAVRAVLALKPGQVAAAEELKAFCRERIAGYKVPRSIEFLKALPKTATGKISKTDLRARLWAAEAEHGGGTETLLTRSQSGG
jgi:acyl-CoA synthetase (AMP-forming)/AMP-acid ligase II